MTSPSSLHIGDNNSNLQMIVKLKLTDIYKHIIYISIYIYII